MANGTLKLKKPIYINGKEVIELKYDTDEISVQAYGDAAVRKDGANVRNKSMGAAGAAELDYAFHLYLGMAAVIAVNTDVDWADLERIKGIDCMALMDIGRNFIVEGSEEDLDPDTFEKQSGSTPKSTTPAKKTSGDED